MMIHLLLINLWFVLKLGYWMLSGSPFYVPIYDYTPYSPYPFTTHTIEDGVLGVKFKVDLPDGWHIWHVPKGNQGSFLLVRNYWDETYGEVHFEISEGTGHPSSWIHKAHHGMDLAPGDRARLAWQRQDTPTEVFTTEHGVTIVKYTHKAPRYSWGWDENYYRDYITAIYKFRQDGQDYRNTLGAQIFYYAMLSAHAEIFEDYNKKVRAIVESIQFIEGAAISLLPTDAATSIGINQTNYPRINGSTSTVPLVQQIFTEMFTQNFGRQDYRPYGAARTIPAYELLIANYVDLIIVPDPSVEALQLAHNAGVQLEFIPVAVEALVFITSTDNPVYHITTEQVLQIYTDKTITNWAQLGGYDGRIVPLNRNPHSGSQTLMDNMVLQDREVNPLFEEYQIGGMMDMLSAINNAWVLNRDEEPYTFALGYTVYFYLRNIEQHGGGWVSDIKVLSLNGVLPSHETIVSGEYLLSTNYFAVMRADTPEDAPARKIVDWLLTPEGQDAVEAAGLGRLGG